MKVYGFFYNPMIEESVYATISLHRTENGAKKAMRLHKKQERKKWKELYSRKDRGIFKFGRFEDWYVKEIEIIK